MADQLKNNPDVDDNGAAQLARFKEAAVNKLGNAIRKPVSARLGYQDETGVVFLKVPQERTDQPSRYYFHEGGGTPYQGEAFLQEGALVAWQIRFGVPIRVERDVLTDDWVIKGLDMRYAAQYFINTPPEDLVLWGTEKLAPGLLTETVPPSMKAQVLSGHYTLGDDWKWIDTLQTVNWGVAPFNTNVPTANGKARWVLVVLNFADEVLEYEYGDLFPSTLTAQQTYAIDVSNGNNALMPEADPDRFRCGYIKLVHGMTSITRAVHIWAAQEYLGRQTAGSLTGAVLDAIVTDSGEVVVDDVTGNVVFVES